MGIQRSSFYNWRHSCMHPSKRRTAFLQNITLFLCYHKKFPSHGYRWLNAKIRLDTGRVMSNPYAHKCCKAVGIKSESRRCHYWKPGARDRVFPNLLMAGLNITGPLQCVVSDMTAFRVKDEYYELKLRTPETLMRQGFIRFSDIRQHHIMHTVSGTFPIDPAVLP